MTGRGALVLVLLVLVAGGIGVAAWVGTSSDGDAAPPPPPQPVAAPRPLRIIFPEGFTRSEMADRVDAVREIAIDRRGITPRLTKQGYLAATKVAVPPPQFRTDWERGVIEGFLFPATYDFTRLTGARRLVADQLRTFRRQWAKVDLRYARSKNLTPYDVLIIASMVEEETAVPAERRLVAAVIYNRLRNGMPLGIDATIRYGLGIPGTESLTKKALATDSPYNTRLRTGLPPTPITNPGLASMQAAAHPAQVDHLYYVRKPGSLSHFFTASESEFLRKVCEYGYACD
ncbi:MAG TPA: endolytic transglycosylase MltG [Gaiellaceae bacterium]